MNESETREKLVRNLEDAKTILEKVKGQVAAIHVRLDPLEKHLRLQGISETSSQIHGTHEKLIILPSALEEEDPLGAVVKDLQDGMSEGPTLIKLKDGFESNDTCKAVVRIVEEILLNSEREGEKTPRIVLILRWAHIPDKGMTKPVAYIGNRFVTRPDESRKRLRRAMENCGFLVYDDSGEYGGGPIAYHLSAHFSGRDVTIVQITIPDESARNGMIVSRLLHCISSIRV